MVLSTDSLELCRFSIAIQGFFTDRLRTIQEGQLTFTCEPY